MYCSACQVESANSLFCHVCDDYLPAKGLGSRAGLVRRVVGVFVDFILMLALVVLSARILASTLAVDPAIDVIGGVALVVSTIAFLVSFSQGSTPGKWAVGIQAVDKRNGEKPGFGRMLLRETIGKVVSSLFFSLGYFWAIWDRDGQAWHDKLAGTVVISRYHSAERFHGYNVWPATAYLSLLLLFALQLRSEHGHVESAASVSAEPSQTGLLQRPPATPTFEAATLKRSQGPRQSETSVYAVSSQQDASKSQIESVLQEWANATARNDAGRAASFYAQHVNRYFLLRNLSRSDVFDDKQKVLARSPLASFALQDVSFDSISPEVAIVVADKVYTANPTETNPLPESKRTRCRLWVVRDGQEWKINGEQDLRN